MAALMNEQKVLRKLGISDFRHMTKEKVMTMASLFDRMEPEVAMKALERFPDFANVMTAALQDLQASLDRDLSANDASAQAFYASCDTVMASCREELQRDSHSADDRYRIFLQMTELVRLKGEKDTENKRFIALNRSCWIGAFLVAVGALAAALGGKVDFRFGGDA